MKPRLKLMTNGTLYDYAPRKNGQSFWLIYGFIIAGHAFLLGRATVEGEKRRDS